MSDINVTIPGGKAKRLKTAGKYCEQDIVVTAEKPMPLTEKEVNFYDYDGTLLYAYTIEEAQALTELPPLPTQPGLTCQGWNWTLNDILELPEESIGADIGAIYETADGKTHCYFEILDKYSGTVELRFTGTLDIEWGDGTVQTGVTSPVTHVYADQGLYVAKLYSASSYYLGGGTDFTRFVGRGINSLVRLHLANNARLHFNGYALNFSLSLRCITIPKGGELGRNGVEYCYNLNFIALSHKNAIGLYSLRSCYSLRTVSVPLEATMQAQGLRDCNSLRRYATAGSTKFYDTYQLYQCKALTEAFVGAYNITASMFSYCNSLRHVVFLEGATKIDTDGLANTSIEKFTIPSTVTNIGSGAFKSCTKLRCIQFKPTTPPTIANADAFTGIPTYCVVEVPAESLETYKNATNYASIAAQMVGGEQL